ncbi:unnamed protein product [Arctia plantaginis]|uniref:Uncharacterized protein n=1 Tax=Arctia plantaginis TaxID=874455 RepID=A0A8S0YNB6_ARCPL|nr:unnamed protein product [Arctia plantaginis]
MAALWTILVILVPLIENIITHNLTHDDILQDPPLTKSFGYTMQKALGARTLDDAILNQKYMYQYKEILKASQESFENFEKPDERRLRRVIGDSNFKLMKEAGVLDRRRNAPRFESPVFKRRARTQALRRNKLNDQSLKSHLQHSQRIVDPSSKLA